MSLMVDAQKNREQLDLRSRRIWITSALVYPQKRKSPSIMGTNVPVSEKAQFRAITVDKLKKKSMTRWASLGEAADIKAMKEKKNS